MALAGSLRAPTQADAEYLAAHIAEADRAEVLSSGHVTVLGGVVYSILASRDTWAWVVEDRVVCIFGIGGEVFLESDEFHPWLLATNELPRYGRDFLRGCKIVVERWRKRYGRMTNYVDARHTKAVRWIKWMGFEVLPAIPLGPQQALFHPFRLEAA